MRGTQVSLKNTSVSQKSTPVSLKSTQVSLHSSPVSLTVSIYVGGCSCLACLACFFHVPHVCLACLSCLAGSHIGYTLFECYHGAFEQFVFPHHGVFAGLFSKDA